MKHIYLSEKSFGNVGAPFQKLMELNIKVLRDMTYLKPNDLASIKSPEEIIEKNMNMFIQNNHQLLNYMRDTFHIWENHWLNTSQDIEDNTRKIVKKTKSAAKKVMKKSMPSHNVAKKTVSGKKTSLKANPKATVKKSIKAKSVVSPRKINVSSPLKKHEGKPSETVKQNIVGHSHHMPR